MLKWKSEQTSDRNMQFGMEQANWPHCLNFIESVALAKRSMKSGEVRYLGSPRRFRLELK